MTNNQRNAPRSRARRRAEQRRLRMIVFGGTAAVVLIAVLAVLLLKPGGGAPDRAVSQPVQGDAGERRIGTDVVGLTQETVAGGEAALEQTEQIDLTTCCCECKKVEIVDMNVTVSVSFCVLRI